MGSKAKGPEASTKQEPDVPVPALLDFQAVTVGWGSEPGAGAMTSDVDVAAVPFQEKQSVAAADTEPEIDEPITELGEFAANWIVNASPALDVKTSAAVYSGEVGICAQSLTVNARQVNVLNMLTKMVAFREKVGQLQEFTTGIYRVGLF